MVSYKLSLKYYVANQCVAASGMFVVVLVWYVLMRRYAGARILENKKDTSVAETLNEGGMLEPLLAEDVRAGRFADTYELVYARNKVWARVFLLVVRVLLFVYFFGAGLVLDILDWGLTNLLMVSLWQMILIEIYFLLAITNSIIGLAMDVSSIHDERTNRKLQYLRHIQEAILFTAAVVASYVSVLHLMADSTARLTNYTIHVGNVVALVIELGMNALYMKVDYFPLPYIIELLYLGVLAILETQNIFETWYASYDVPSFAAEGLLAPAITTLSAILWLGLSYLKYGVVRRCNGNIILGGGNSSKHSTNYESSSAFARRTLPKSNGTTVYHWSMLYSSLGSKEAVTDSGSVSSRAPSSINGELAESTCPFHKL